MIKGRIHVFKRETCILLGCCCRMGCLTRRAASLVPITCFPISSMITGWLELSTSVRKARLEKETILTSSQLMILECQNLNASRRLLLTLPQGLRAATLSALHRVLRENVGLRPSPVTSEVLAAVRTAL